MKEIELIYSKALEKKILIDKLNPVSSEEIAECEKKIRYSLPSSYKNFLLYQGLGGLGSIEFLGLIKDDLYLDSYMNALTKTIQFISENKIPNNLFVIQILDDEHLACLDLSITNNNENPVVMWSIYEQFDKQIERFRYELADNFFEYFMLLIDEE